MIVALAKKKCEMTFDNGENNVRIIFLPFEPIEVTKMDDEFVHIVSSKYEVRLEKSVAYEIFDFKNYNYGVRKNEQEVF